MANKGKEKLLSMRRVCSVQDSVAMDSVANSKLNDKARAMEVLCQAQRYHMNMDEFRRERERNKRYTYGKQWEDVICVDGRRITEAEYIKKQGNVPLKNNLIRRLVRSVLGVYRSQSKEPICTARDRDEQRVGETMSTILQCNRQLNRMNEVSARSIEEFLISGFIVHRKWFGWRNDELDCWTDYVQPNNFFIDDKMRDFRGWDVSCVGEIHDVSFGTLLGQFAQSPEDYNKLSKIYKDAKKQQNIVNNLQGFGISDDRNISFFMPKDGSLCRVIEVWRKESKPRYRIHDPNNGDIYKIDVEDYQRLFIAVNEQRKQQALEAGMDLNDVPFLRATWFIDNYWYYYYLTPFGDILAEGETPYEHKSHPYVFKAYPFIDGEIHSFVNDVIDQQRYTNRLITLYDWIMRSSAKGVLLVPEQSLGTMSIEDIADEWSRFNGVIAYQPKAGVPIPQQIAVNSTNIGISELLNIQLKFFEDISGIHGALQGKPGYSMTSGSLYAQQTQNATTSLLDLLETFGQFIVDGAYKDVKNMQQFYDEKRVSNIAGKSGKIIVYDPKLIRDVEFDLSIVESTATPAYRQIANEFLLQIWKSGQINLEQLLEHGDFPFADELLQSIKTQQAEIQQQGTVSGIPQQIQQQAAQGADMDAVNRAYEMLRAS
ncbi:portal protein [Prevotella nigrescens]|uniref:portal protein n=1 Tax=Prevotella nigrescens TaxID=28133 RepID=UPI0028808B7E|nr:hypothetical protein [Prevotella nigrescens]